MCVINTEECIQKVFLKENVYRKYKCRIRRSSRKSRLKFWLLNRSALPRKPVWWFCLSRERPCPSTRITNPPASGEIGGDSPRVPGPPPSRPLPYRGRNSPLAAGGTPRSSAPLPRGSLFGLLRYSGGVDPAPAPGPAAPAAELYWHWAGADWSGDRFRAISVSTP
jgi:hypothetical protein